MTKPLSGWVKAPRGIERYRYPLGNGRMLMVVGHSARKWYFGECAEARNTRWAPAGRQHSMRAAMKAALALDRDLRAQENHNGHDQA
jgi:hypothetical protein